MEDDAEQQQPLSFCPSFNSYSSVRFAGIADEVAAGGSGGAAEAEVTVLQERAAAAGAADEEDDFEFAFARGDDPDVTAEEIFPGGQVRHVFPIFNRDLVVRDDERSRGAGAGAGADKLDVSTLRLPLKQLFSEDRDDRDPPSSSSSDADELEGVPEGTYCVWRPKVVEASPGRCKKSHSTGSSSKRWKFRDLLRRSNSEGKDAFVFLTPKNRDQKADRPEGTEVPKQRRNSADGFKASGKTKAKGLATGGEKASSSAHEAFYVRNRASKEGDKRKSYLPYRQDLVGFFANVNGLGRNFPPF
ncbi:uncharacterized protein LOC127803192 [Diospyros lotus]|uniref:uncharacterized protein LOC127803192 n=1 Tax=Diospyros lotus TaxID=55363 RepID=UPI002257898A|nr:uncharacterized protein LOC127803192 [Diospyros lotus]